MPPGGSGLAVGQYAEVSRRFAVRDVEAFADLTGDHNPIHMCPTGEGPAKPSVSEVREVDGVVVCSREAHINKSKGGRCVHGILMASLFPAVISAALPNSIYRSQELKFHQRLAPDRMAMARVSVKSLKVLKRRGVLMTCETTIFMVQDGVLVVSGEGQVLVPEGTVFSEDRDGRDNPGGGGGIANMKGEI